MTYLNIIWVRGSSCIILYYDSKSIIIPNKAVSRNSLYPPVIKRGNWKSTRNVGFIRKITYIMFDSWRVDMGRSYVVFPWLRGVYNHHQPPASRGPEDISASGSPGGWRSLPRSKWEANSIGDIRFNKISMSLWT